MLLKQKLNSAIRLIFPIKISEFSVIAAVSYLKSTILLSKKTFRTQYLILAFQFIIFGAAAQAPAIISFTPSSGSVRSTRLSQHTTPTNTPRGKVATAGKSARPSSSASGSRWASSARWWLETKDKKVNLFIIDSI